MKKFRVLFLAVLKIDSVVSQRQPAVGFWMTATTLLDTIGTFPETDSNSLCMSQTIEEVCLVMSLAQWRVKGTGTFFAILSQVELFFMRECWCYPSQQIGLLTIGIQVPIIWCFVCSNKQMRVSSLLHTSKKLSSDLMCCKKLPEVPIQKRHVNGKCSSTSIVC